jgi:hypothetical protein
MTYASDELQEMITRMEQALSDLDAVEFDSAQGEPPRPFTYHISSDGYGSLSDRRKERHGKLIWLRGGRARLQVYDGIVAGLDLEMAVFLEKSPKGETVCHTGAHVEQISRISGGYDATVTLQDLTTTLIPARKKFLESVASESFAAWNRWYADLTEGAILTDLELSETRLVNYDLCLADLSGSNFEGANLAGCNLSGADLSGCNLDRVRLGGADLFGARIPRRYLGLVAASGLVEVESVSVVS